MKTRKFLIKIIITALIVLILIELLLNKLNLLNTTIFDIFQDIYISLGITFFIYIAEYLDQKRNIISKIFEEILRIYRTLLMIKTSLANPNISIEKVKKSINEEIANSISNLKIVTSDYSTFFNSSKSFTVQLVNNISKTLMQFFVSIKDTDNKEKIDNSLNTVVLNIKNEVLSIKQLKEYIDEADGMNPILFDIYNNKKNADEIANIFDN